MNKTIVICAAVVVGLVVIPSQYIVAGIIGGVAAVVGLSYIRRSKKGGDHET